MFIGMVFEFIGIECSLVFCVFVNVFGVIIECSYEDVVGKLMIFFDFL